MSSAETSKKESTEEKALLPLKVTIEDPNTGETFVAQPNLFVGVYTRKTENTPEGTVGVGQVLKGRANILEQISVAKILQEKVIPMLLDQIESKLAEEEGEGARNYTDKLSVLLSTLLSGQITEQGGFQWPC